MPSVTAFHFSFTPSWRMILLTLISMGLFIRLGYWQLDRGQEKRRLVAAYQTQATQLPTPFPGVDPKPYQRLSVQGHYLPINLLLDNQHHDHLFGYDVLTPFMLTNGKVVIIDRGWVNGDNKRTTFPNLTTPSSPQTITGQAYFPSPKRWLLGEAIDVKSKQLAVLETMDITIMSQFLHKSLYPFIIRQSPDDAEGYLRAWAIVSSSPERHDGYALQWFMFAFVVGILFIALNVKKIK